jgi:hypothetical protein
VPAPGGEVPGRFVVVVGKIASVRDPGKEESYVLRIDTMTGATWMLEEVPSGRMFQGKPSTVTVWMEVTEGSKLEETLAAIQRATPGR